MKKLNLEQMEMVEGGFKWSNPMCSILLVATAATAAAANPGFMYGLVLMSQADCWTGSLF